MTKTSEMHNLCKELNIHISATPLPDHIRGVFSSQNGENDVLLNSAIIDSSVLYRSVLAEEIGHYFTSIGIHPHLSKMTYSQELEYDRCEHRALQWASDYTIETDLLLKAIKSNEIKAFSDIGKYFDVTDDIVLKKLSSMAEEKLSWEIDTFRSLVLSNLPSVWIFDKSVGAFGGGCAHED